MLFYIGSETQIVFLKHSQTIKTITLTPGKTTVGSQPLALGKRKPSETHQRPRMAKDCQGCDVSRSLWAAQTQAPPCAGCLPEASEASHSLHDTSCVQILCRNEANNNFEELEKACQNDDFFCHIDISRICFWFRRTTSSTTCTFWKMIIKPSCQGMGS